jgi:hypothetical protein
VQAHPLDERLIRTATKLGVSVREEEECRASPSQRAQAGVGTG